MRGFWAESVRHHPPYKNFRERVYSRPDPSTAINRRPRIEILRDRVFEGFGRREPTSSSAVHKFFASAILHVRPVAILLEIPFKLPARAPPFKRFL